MGNPHVERDKRRSAPYIFAAIEIPTLSGSEWAMPRHHTQTHPDSHPQAAIAWPSDKIPDGGGYAMYKQSFDKSPPVTAGERNRRYSLIRG